MKSGLEDVVAAETILSDVDGLAGRLIMRGVSLDDLAGTPYEQLLSLLWAGFFELPQDLPGALARARTEVFAHVA
ncbi:MAG: citrate synthase/methylcitrate synthase, partial [Devosia nanyangense]|nr:citrate synthase/methylcitrate synthase [Devosia nanyangense]